MGTYRDPSSDNDATNPLDSAPDGATVVAIQDGHVSIPDAHQSVAKMDKARNARDW